MNKLLVVQAFRPDRLIAAAHQFVMTVLGSEFMASAEKELDLANIVENEVEYSSAIWSKRSCYISD